MTKPYAIITPIADPKGIDWSRVVASLEALDVGQAFVIPAKDISDEEGNWATSTIGSRVHQSARRRGLQVRTMKIMGEGLQVKRIA